MGLWWPDWSGSGYGPVESSCERCNEPSGCVKCKSDSRSYWYNSETSEFSRGAQLHSVSYSFQNLLSSVHEVCWVGNKLHSICRLLLLVSAMNCLWRPHATWQVTIWSLTKHTTQITYILNNSIKLGWTGLITLSYAVNTERKRFYL
jgi:hypothetical protein